MGRKKTDWSELLAFDSVKTYLNGSIGSKKSQIDSNGSFEEKIESVNLSNYLRGLQIYLNQYCKFAKNPYELIKYYREGIRSENEDYGKTVISTFKQSVEDFTAWLKNKLGLSPKTSVAYQSHVRGFCSHSGINLGKLRNYDVDSERSRINEKHGIEFEEIKEILFKVIEYTTDKNLKLLLEFMKRTGIGSREVLDLTFGDLRYRKWENDFVKLEKRREKSGIRFKTWIYGDLKREIVKYLENHKDYPDEQKWLLKGYHTFMQSFTTAYNRVINAEFPEYKDIEKKVATMHGFRKVFKTTGIMLRIPEGIIDLFVGHKRDSITRAYEKDNKQLLNWFKEIQEEIFGIKESDTREKIEREIVEKFMEVLTNKGKRQTIFNQFIHKEEDLKEESNDVKMGFFMESLMNTMKKELLEDEDFLKQLKSKL